MEIYPLMLLWFWGKIAALKPPNFPKCLIVHLCVCCIFLNSSSQGGGKRIMLYLVSQANVPPAVYLSSGCCYALSPCSNKYMRTWWSFLLTWLLLNGNVGLKMRVLRGYSHLRYNTTLQSSVPKTQPDLQQFCWLKPEAAGYHLPLSWTSALQICKVRDYTSIYWYFSSSKQLKPNIPPPVLWARNTSVFMYFYAFFFPLTRSLLVSCSTLSLLMYLLIKSFNLLYCKKVWDSILG